MLTVTSLGVVLVAVALAAMSIVVGVVAARRQKCWWLHTMDDYERALRLRVSESVSTADKGEALAASVRALYGRMGYRIAEQKRAHDRGIDVIAQLFGRYGIQCKNLQKPASIDAVYEAYAGSRYWNCCQHCAVVVSPSGFTDEARDFAATVGVRLVDDATFRSMMQRFEPFGFAWPRGVARVLQEALLAASIIAAAAAYALPPADAAVLAVIAAASIGHWRSRSRELRAGPHPDALRVRELVHAEM